MPFLPPNQQRQSTEALNQQQKREKTEELKSKIGYAQKSEQGL